MRKRDRRLSHHLNDPEIDAVSVCTPNLMHKTIAIDALRAGSTFSARSPQGSLLRGARDAEGSA